MNSLLLNIGIVTVAAMTVLAAIKITCEYIKYEQRNSRTIWEGPRIQHTRDTLDNWSKADPIMPEGQICLVIDGDTRETVALFIGNGKNKFSELKLIKL